MLKLQVSEMILLVAKEQSVSMVGHILWIILTAFINSAKVNQVIYFDSQVTTYLSIPSEYLWSEAVATF